MPEIPPPQFVDYNGIELQLGDKVVVSRSGGRSASYLDIGTIEKFHPKSDKVTVLLDREVGKWESQKVVVNNGRRKFVRL